MPQQIPKRLNLDTKDIERYSLANAVAYTVEPETQAKRAKFEKDLSDEVGKIRNDTTDGIFVPAEILSHRFANPLGYPVPSHILTRQVLFNEPAPPLMPRHDEITSASQLQRALNIAGNEAQGGALVETELGSLIEALVRSSIALQNIPTFDAMGSPVKIPGFSTVPEAGWTGEVGTAPESNPTFNLRNFTTKELRCFCKLSRTLILQASGAVVENFVRNDMALSVARELDRACFLGSGSSHQPRGIRNITGTNSLTLTADLMDNTIEAIKMVGKNNHRFNNMLWVLSWTLCDAMKLAKKYGATSRLPVLGKDGRIHTMPVEVTSQLTDKSGFFGNFMESAICLWDDLRLEVDTKTLLHQGITRIFAFMSLDFNALRPSAFTNLLE